MSTILEELAGEELIAAVNKAGGQRAFSRKHGIPRTTLQGKLQEAYRAQFKHRPVDQAAHEHVESGVRRFILTSAQDSTRIHEGFLNQLEAYRDWLGDCEILIAGFTYNKSLFSDTGKHATVWPSRIKPYMRWERIRIGDKIDFCAEMNTRPTAETPLQGFETYTRHRWGIFPHPKVQLRSIPTMKHEPAKIIMTTGSVSLPNYVPMRAGIKAQFHHVIGAVLVEINDEGTFFCRHLLAEDDGSFYDLDRRVSGGEVTEGNRVEAINWGDLHVAQMDPVASATCFGISPTTMRDASGRMWAQSTSPTTILDTLKPRYQFFHDVADFQARNHHNLKDPHLQFQLYTQGADNVENEMREVAMFISCTQREWCQTVVVESNHDLALRRWLKEADYRHDPKNAKFFLKCQLAAYEAIEQGRHDFSIFEHVLTKGFAAWDCDGVRFLKTDESFMVLGIEKGMHGHNGANGARGTPNAFTKMGPKATTGHTHSCEIRDGIYTAGVTANLDMGYNVGLSSWSQSHVVTLPNAKRQIITMQNGEWRL